MNQRLLIHEIEESNKALIGSVLVSIETVDNQHESKELCEKIINVFIDLVKKQDYADDKERISIEALNDCEEKGWKQIILKNNG